MKTFATEFKKAYGGSITEFAGRVNRDPNWIYYIRCDHYSKYNGKLANIDLATAELVAHGLRLPADYFNQCVNINGGPNQQEVISEQHITYQRKSKKKKSNKTKRTNGHAKTALTNGHKPDNHLSLKVQKVEMDYLPWVVETFHVIQKRISGPMQEMNLCVSNLRASGFSITSQGAYTDDEIFPQNDAKRFLVTAEKFMRGEK